jgi:hypothetical protein
MKVLRVLKHSVIRLDTGVELLSHPLALTLIVACGGMAVWPGGRFIAVLGQQPSS